MGLIHLIRHAEPTLSGVFLGRADPGLRLRPQRSSVTVECVFSSPLRRARDTASALFPDCEMVVLNELTELSLGEWDGLTWEEIERRDPDLAAQKLADWNHVTPPGGESYAAIEGRARTAVEHFRIASANSAIAVVAHSGINAALWSQLTGHPPERFSQNYLEVITCEL